MTALFLYTQNMKRILFLVVCLMSFSAKADMDKICTIFASDSPDEIVSYILQECERNNVLYWRAGGNQVKAIATWCRFDRNVERFQTSFTCILYSNKPRKDERE